MAVGLDRVVGDGAPLQVDGPEDIAVVVLDVPEQAHHLAEEVRAHVQEHVLVAGGDDDVVWVGHGRSGCSRKHRRDGDRADGVLVVGVQHPEQGGAVEPDLAELQLPDRPAGDEVRPARADLEDAAELGALAHADLLHQAERMHDLPEALGLANQRRGQSRSWANVGQSRRPRGQQRELAVGKAAIFEARLDCVRFWFPHDAGLSSDVEADGDAVDGVEDFDLFFEQVLVLARDLQAQHLDALDDPALFEQLDGGLDGRVDGR